MENSKKAVICLIVSLVCIALLVCLNVLVLTAETPDVGDSPYAGLGIYMYGMILYTGYILGTLFCTITGALCALLASLWTSKIAIRVVSIITTLLHAGCLVGLFVLYGDTVLIVFKMILGIG